MSLMHAEHALTHSRPNAAIDESDASPSMVIELLHEDAEPPRRATQGSAGYDLFAYLTGRTIDCSDGHRRWTETGAVAETLARILLPSHAMALIPLGYPERGRWAQPKRQPLVDVVHWGRWGSQRTQ